MKAIVAFIYGLILCLGGVFGYLKAKSSMSLIFGLLFGVILILSGLLVLKGHQIGKWIAIYSTIFLTIFFGYRCFLRPTFFPAGFMIVIGIIAIILFIKK